MGFILFNHDKRTCIDSQINVVLHQPHARVAGPALLVVVADNVLIVRVRMLRQVALDQIAGFFSGKPTKQMQRKVKYISNNCLCHKYVMKLLHNLVKRSKTLNNEKSQKISVIKINFEK